MKIRIYTHSIIDVITNSSSEIFTIETDKTVDFLVEVINNFCEENKIKYRFSSYSFDSIEEDYDVKEAIELLESYGYVITKKDTTKKGYVFSIDNNWTCTPEGKQIKNFLIEEFSAEVDYA